MLLADGVTVFRNALCLLMKAAFCSAEGLNVRITSPGALLKRKPAEPLSVESSQYLTLVVDIG